MQRKSPTKGSVQYWNHSHSVSCIGAQVWVAFSFIFSIHQISINHSHFCLCMAAKSNHTRTTTNHKRSHAWCSEHTFFERQECLSICTRAYNRASQEQNTESNTFSLIKLGEPTIFATAPPAIFLFSTAKHGGSSFEIGFLQIGEKSKNNKELHGCGYHRNSPTSQLIQSIPLCVAHRWWSVSCDRDKGTAINRSLSTRSLLLTSLSRMAHNKHFRKVVGRQQFNRTKVCRQCYGYTQYSFYLSLISLSHCQEHLASQVHILGCVCKS